MRRRLIVALVAAAAASIPAAAQRPDQASAEISGTVTTTGVAPVPLARALVTIAGESLKPSRTAVTDEHGRFAFRNLPPGKVTIVAARPPYVKTAFGARRAGRPGTAIDLAAGQIVSNVTVRLARGAAITGLVRHPDGDAASGVKVVATSIDRLDGPAGATAVTDDRGIYRVFGLAPGEYIVKASASERLTAGVTQMSDAQMDEILALLRRRFGGDAGASAIPGRPVPTASSTEVPARSATYTQAPVFYPGTPDPDRAETFVLAEGDERIAGDFDLQFVRALAIHGHVTMPGGPLPPATQVTLTRAGSRGRATDSLVPPAAARPDASGAFRFTAVLPGRYRILARAVTMAPAREAADGVPGAPPQSRPVRVTEVYWAAVDAAVADDDLSGLALTLRPGLTLTGRVAFDARVLAPPQTVQLQLEETGDASSFVRSGGARADGTFEIGGLAPGTYAISARLPDAGWWLRSVVIDGRDVLDFPLEIGASGDVSGAVATFTDRRSEVSGVLQSAPNAPASDYFVVIVSADRTFWRPGSRRVRFTRPGIDGRFVFRDLPAGDYLIAAAADVEASDLSDASFIERLMPSALKVSLREGETKTQDLKLVRQ
jgi:hypothetical protein